MRNRTFRHSMDQYFDEGLDGLLDKRMSQIFQRKAPVDDVVRLKIQYKARCDGGNVKHIYGRYREEHQGGRFYSWVKKPAANDKSGWSKVAEEGAPKAVRKKS